MEISDTLKAELKEIATSAESYFAVASEDIRDWMAREDRPSYHLNDTHEFVTSGGADSLQLRMTELESKISRWATAATARAQSSALLNAADLSDLRINVRKMVAALNFRDYEYSEAYLMSWEDTVYGVQPASQQERYTDVRSAAALFQRAVDQIGRTLLFVQAERFQNVMPSQVSPPISGAHQPPQRPDTAFIMMWMSDEHPELDDVKAGIVEVFGEFGIQAIRADDIEHDDVITERIVQEIASAEFLIADLTGARPNVYYEIGYAHALGKRVILYRKKDAALHFDLAGRNVPGYTNVTDLKQKLRARLAAMLGFESSTTSRVSNQRRNGTTE